MVVCHRCRKESGDNQVCVHCRTALLDAGEVPTSVALPDGRIVDCAGFAGIWPANPFRPVRVAGAYRLYALSRPWWVDLRAGIERRMALALPVLGAVHVVPIGEAALVVAEALPDGRPLRLTEGGLDDCRHLASAMSALHGAGLVWLEFDPAELVVAGDRVQITNLDLGVSTAGVMPEAVLASAAYISPELASARYWELSPATDVFHLGLYVYYRLAGLLPDGFAGGGPEAFRHEFPALRIYCPDLPPGVESVLRRALARDPIDRFTTPVTLIEALGRCLSASRGAHSSLTWDCGADSVIGLSHEISGVPNQDAFTMLSLDRGRTLYLVADGVTTCTVGSGELASAIALEVLALELPELLRAADTLARIEVALIEGCARASEVILHQAKQLGIPPGTDPAELMSTTVVIGYTHGGTFSLASLGDSRAYLVRDGVAEQLTVDGDMRCTHLAAGATPEEVQTLGADGLALFSCLGVGELHADGRITRSRTRTCPHVMHWSPRPGDVVVLATDGLVEEGIYLHPDDLARIVRVTPPGDYGVDLNDMALSLVAAARSLHRSASPAEPGGVGDDVTCIVLKARPASS